MLSRLFLTRRDGIDKNRDDHDHWKRNAGEIASFVGLAGIAATGALLGYLFGQPKAFLVIALAILLWTGIGLLAGGWRAMLVGITVLSAALVASEGNYLGAFLLAVASFLLLHTEIILHRK